MKTVQNYIFEAGRGRPRKNQQEPGETPELKDVQGKSPERNDSGGSWSVDWAPDDPQPITKEELNDNMCVIFARIKQKRPFFVQGEAGWGKTSVIKDIAKRCRLHVVVVYLDKVEAVELAGYPVPEKGKDGRARINRALPEWADLIHQNSDKDFLLFFDEMNQATPDVMNALMPIVLENTVAGVEFDNIVIGAAGNFESENKGGISKLSTPLEQRFGGVIKWESNTPATWSQAMGFLRKKYKQDVPDEVMDYLDDIHNVFDSPRMIDHHVLKAAVEQKKSGTADYLPVSYWVKELQRTISHTKELERSDKDKINVFAEMLWKFTNDKLEKKVGRSSKAKKDSTMLNADFVRVLKSAAVKGYMPLNGKKYGISRENVAEFIDEEECNAEMFDSLMDKFEADGVEFKYKTNDEWKAAGYLDPNDAPEQ